MMTDFFLVALNEDDDAIYANKLTPMGMEDSSIPGEALNKLVDERAHVLTVCAHKDDTYKVITKMHIRKSEDCGDENATAPAVGLFMALLDDQRRAIAFYENLSEAINKPSGYSFDNLKTVSH
jgi:hypothetical protein